MTDHFVIMSW